MPTQTRRLAAIMFTDIVGYTAMMQTDEQNAISLVKRHQEVLERNVELHQGKVFQYYGDGSLSLFHSATEAVHCAMDIQLEYKNAPVVPLRIGIHIGEILIEGDKIFGDGVNIASRIESLGQVGTVMYSENVHQKIKNNSKFRSVALGAIEFKNVSEPIEVFALSNDGFPVPEVDSLSGKIKPKQVTTKKSVWKNAVFVGLIVVISALFTWFLNEKLDNAQLPDVETADTDLSIMVLPFDNFSDVPDQQFFVDGIADELRSQLFSIKDLKVISRSSSRFYKNSNKSLTQLGKELDIKYVLEGTVQRSEDIVKVNVQLSNTETQEVEWSSPSFQEKLEDIFLLQNKISQQIVNQLKLGLSIDEKMQLIKIPTRNADAYINYQKGQELVKRGGGNIEELDASIDYFEKAIELDPEFSLAYVGLSEAYLEYIFWGRHPSNMILPMALDAAFKALELDDEKVEIYAALGAINFYRYDAVKSREFLEKAIELSPNYHPPYEWLAWINVFENKKIEATQLFKTAHELEPLSAKYLGDQGLGFFYLGLYDEGMKFIDEVLMKYPNDNFLLWVKALLYVAQEKYDEAIATYRQRTAGTETNWMLGYAHAMAGNKEAAQRILDIQLEKRKQQHVPAFMIATIYLGLGDLEKTMEWLEVDWIEQGQGVMLWGLDTDIRFFPLQDDPRFQDLIQKINAGIN